MLAFDDFPYERPDLAAVKHDTLAAVERFRSAATFEAANAAMAEVNRLREAFDSRMNIAQIRHTMNTEDAFYEAENDFFDEAEPELEGLVSEYYKVLIASPFRARLEERWGGQVFRLADAQIRTFRPEIVEDLQLENRLSSEYVKLKASAKIMFEGEERNLSQLAAFGEDADRGLRRSSKQAVAAFYAENDAEFGRIFHELVQVRARIAKALCYESFIPLAYDRLQRTDYDASSVAAYRRQIREDLVPVAAALRKRQAARLGLAALTYWDEDLAFLSGNARPKGDPEWILERGSRMYREMSAETGEFFEMMSGRKLLDLVTRPGKAGGGYCAYIPDQQAPFIFSNFNGTSGDVDVLTHEAGHAFQCYCSRSFALPEYHWPTLEACEIHSMSMEFFAWPWMESFFEADAPKYRFNHLSEALYFVPYGAAVDEFQHWVYQNPEVSHADRKRQWRAIERQYLPWRDYDGEGFLEEGGFWLRQGHIFEDPFYYIDYTLAQVCAFEYWGRSRNGRDAAWASYLELCRQGGSQPFTGLLKVAGLSNPFEPGTIRRILGPVRAWLEDFDDRGL